jgi:hypothetical protein
LSTFYKAVKSKNSNRSRIFVTNVIVNDHTDDLHHIWSSVRGLWTEDDVTDDGHGNDGLLYEGRSITTIKSKITKCWLYQRKIVQSESFINLFNVLIQSNLSTPYTSLGSTFMLGIDRCWVYTGQINKYFLHWYFIQSLVYIQCHFIQCSV